MKKRNLFILSLVSLFALGACAKGSDKENNDTPVTPTDPENPGGGGGGGGGGGTDPDTPSHTETEVQAYMDELKKTSVENHLYVHYYRYEQKVSDYNEWDIWAWPLSPKAGEGYRFNWDGRTNDISDPGNLNNTSNAKMDKFGFVCADIDLTATYDGGWNDEAKTMGGTPTTFYQQDGTTLDKVVGIQVVKSSTRVTGGSFWDNDGSNLKLTIENFIVPNTNNKDTYHVFLYQDLVQSPKAKPASNGEITDPFANDKGENYTYGKDAYNNVNWTDKALQTTSQDFLNSAGVGYQIMVASFADSDGDGNGDIYGITQKLDYLENLGVKVLWLTPIQLSDSYHGYDIADYVMVDPKFGSLVSPNAQGASELDSGMAMKDYQDLLAAAHEKGMKVVMDLVINHTSTTNQWFINSAQLQQAYRGYYQWGNHETQGDVINEDNYWYPYGSHAYSYYAKFGSSMPELNYAYQSTRDAVADVAKFWCDIGVDGFRMDAVKHIFLNDEVVAASSDTIVNDVSAAGDYSSNLTKNLNFWKELAYEVKSDYPNCFFVGENFDGHAYHVAPYYEGFDSLFDFYSYFNLTSVASHAWHGYTGGGSSAGYYGMLCSYLGVDGSIDSQQDWESGQTAWSAAKELSDGDLSGSTNAFKYGDKWSFRGVMSTNNKYRTGGTAPSNADGYSAINGAFTSNHDIARCINRIAGNEWSDSGLEAQGNVTTSSYESLDTMATLVEIVELMLPGCTWIYYGDELGMTGNFPAGKDSHSDYADLYYRQPMKWEQDGEVGDGSMTTGYGVTGSSMVVEWDEVNASSSVASAAAQTADENSHYSVLSKFAKAKNSSQALIRGNFAALPIEAAEKTGKEAAVIYRTLGSEQYRLYVNFGTNELTVYNQLIDKIGSRSAVLVKGDGTVVASYGGHSGGGGGGGGTTDAIQVTMNVTADGWDPVQGVEKYAIWAWGGNYGNGQYVVASSINATDNKIVFDMINNATGFKLLRFNPDNLPANGSTTWTSTGLWNSSDNITFVPGQTSYSITVS
ncbi:MAG: hypothetical protein K6F07_02455 [Bacilli bacterium]|nr:hypothetical protein [Bacilli bacterium]